METNEPSASRFYRKIRLDPSNYRRIGAICSVTISVPARRAVFADSVTAASAVDVLVVHAQKTSVPIYSYCVMPDHVHLLIGPSVSCDIMTFVGQYKNLAQRAAWQCGVKGAFWQKSFWDHFLRAGEQVEHAVEYILNNPVRRGLVEQWADYPFSGSLVFAVRTEGGGQAPALRGTSEGGGQAPALRGTSVG